MRSAFFVCLALVLAGPGLSWSAAEDKVDFNRQVRPILANNCFRCHGPDAKTREADLRLDDRAAATAPRDGKPAISPGHPEKSELFRRIASADPDERMPPADTGKKLSPQEIETLKQWIAGGAAYARHWAYVKPVRPPLPEVRDGGWVKNPIDRFILARLEREGLKPSPEADRYALGRRLALDLTGLPPTPDEAERFAADKDPAAYEHMVDRLLASPAYGEHWARVWLDAARYADSGGYVSDEPRQIWAFRDYVIRALNANEPFDRFTIEQLAGDLLPNPTEDQLIATAFHRNTPTNTEGGTDDEEFRNVAVVDRVNTTMAVWMGTTMACAQCHDHKYDPITQEDYFRFFAFLNNTEDADRQDEAPVLPFYTADQKAQRAKWEAEIAELEKRFAAPPPQVLDSMKTWDQDFPRNVAWAARKPASAAASGGAAMTIEDDAAVLAAPGKDQETYTIELPLSGERLSAVRIEVLTRDSLPGKGPGHGPGGSFAVSHVAAWLVPPGDAPKPGAAAPTPQPLALAEAYADEDGPGATLVLDEKARQAANKDGWSPGGGKPHTLTLVLAQPVAVSAGATLRVAIEQKGSKPKHTLGLFRISTTDHAGVGLALRTPAPVVEALAAAPEKRTGPQQAAIREHYVRNVAPELAAERQRLAALKGQLAALKPGTVPIMRELAGDKRRKTHVQYRGNFLSLGPEVTPGVPSVFPPLPPGAPLDRLTLARWLVSPDNPLTARVTVNGYWERLFGTGLVATSEEFGTQGELPSHPELLDWLAVEFVEKGWDQKHLVRLVVTSAAYRQSSRAAPELWERDPDNRLLARGPRFRLDAEVVRDQALAVAGLLSRTMYGPPVRPLQPSFGLSAAFGPGMDWTTSEGEDRYRRGLYTTWRRTNPYPSMVTFDSPSREVCTLRRGRTNTPLQALVTLNDPVYVEAAQALARRMVREGGPTEADKARHGFRLCLARAPSAAELERLVRLHQQARQRYSKEKELARQMATVPIGPAPPGADVADLAAWTVVGNVLLNLDETLMPP